MFLGRYVAGDKVWVLVCSHKFETGEEMNATFTGWYLKVGDSPASKVAITFNQLDSETGVYYAEIDTAGFDDAVYMVLCEALVDTVNANATYIFEVREVYGRYAP